MQYKTLGNTGLIVSRICLGTMNFGTGRGVYKRFILRSTSVCPATPNRPCCGTRRPTTPRLVAKYADACNIFGPEVARKLDVLREHCAGTEPLQTLQMLADHAIPEISTW